MICKLIHCDLGYLQEASQAEMQKKFEHIDVKLEALMPRVCYDLLTKTKNSPMIHNTRKKNRLLEIMLFTVGLWHHLIEKDFDTDLVNCHF